ncbi:DUF86 domain-containing protein [Terriglobus sp. TAA 43]|uniref:HepT-like ribonuclease domain-containing protein n=1 Tax=Terriglobus sp. TAA 43 TaxID=278961 RepID=UPI000645BE6C|nr:HepT-like ribonuclease domain-containing protein [Terriglobus sp. TAA 43]
MLPEIRLYLSEVVGAASEVVEYTSGQTFVSYMADGMRRRSVERCLEIVGEGLIRIRRIDEEFVQQLPDAGKIIGLRNILAHEYGVVDHEILWKAVREQLPDFLNAVQAELDRIG